MVDASLEGSLLNLQEGLNVLWEWRGIAGGKQGRLLWIQENEGFGGGSFTPTQSHLQCACISLSFTFILHTDCFQHREEADGFV